MYSWYTAVLYLIQSTELVLTGGCHASVILSLPKVFAFSFADARSRWNRDSPFWERQTKPKRMHWRYFSHQLYFIVYQKFLKDEALVASQFDVATFPNSRECRVPNLASHSMSSIHIAVRSRSFQTGGRESITTIQSRFSKFPRIWKSSKALISFSRYPRTNRCGIRLSLHSLAAWTEEWRICVNTLADTGASQ